MTREARFHFDADKERFVIGRTLARLQLSRFLGGDPRQWRFVTNQHGRPELVEPPGPRSLGFNVSHTHGLIACVIAATQDVGVDVEWIDAHADPRHRRSFLRAARGRRSRAALPPEDQKRVFFDYWTLKEAYIKARGMGLALPLADFAFTLAPPRAPTIAFSGEIHDQPDTWQFEQSWPTPAHRLAVAVRRAPGCDVVVRIENVVPEVHD